MRHLQSFNEFSLFEGGKAIEIARGIKQSEVKATVDSIEETLFPVLGISGWGKDALLIGSAGKKLADEDLSGDLDIGVPIKEFADNQGISEDMALKYLYDTLRKNFPEFQARWMRGVDVVSVGYPIKGDPNLGYVQVDFIPLKDMNWAKFIYHSPNYRKGESSYKSAHRNWLFAAILSTITEDEQHDDKGQLLSFSGYMMRLNDGLSKIKKSFVGKSKLLKNAKNLKDEEQLITRSPEEFIEFILGPGLKQKDVETFEQVWHIMSSPGYKWAEKLPQIKSEYVRFLRRVKLNIPAEIKNDEDDKSRELTDEGSTSAVDQ